jgi:hypothetical protein
MAAGFAGVPPEKGTPMPLVPMTKKRAFLVLGPESMGNRFVTSYMIAAGCRGDAGHDQRLDQCLNNPEILQDFGEPLVWRRSLPYEAETKRTWPDLEQMLARLTRYGYQTRAVAIFRNQYCTVQSDTFGPEHHVDTIEEAELNIFRGMRRISSFVLENQIPAYLTTYESMVLYPEFFDQALKQWRLTPPAHRDVIKDANLKYLSALKQGR